VNIKGEKIQKVLAASGLCSRRGAEELIRRGFVRVNGTVVDNPAVRVDPTKDRIECRGKIVPPPRKTVEGLILYKRSGYITSTGDPHHRKTVYSLLPPEERSKRWLYVGLDSGELVHRLSHPSFKVKKHYEVKIGGRISPSQLKHLVDGIEVEGRLLHMDRACILKLEEETTLLEVVLHHGEKRQIKKMLGRLGFEVLQLRRTRFGPLTLAGLNRGQSRRLTREEVKALIQAVT